MATKVLIMVPFLKGTGGTESVIANLIRAAQTTDGSDDIDLHLVSFGGTIYQDWQEGWQVKCYNFSSIRFVQNICYLLLMPFLIFLQLLRQKPNVVIATNPIIWGITFLLSKISPDGPVVISWYHFSLAQKPIAKIWLFRADYYLAISSGIARELVQSGIASNKIFTIFNPVDIATSAVSRSNDGRNFVYMGRIDFDGQKNVAELFWALAHVKTPITLRLYGTVDTETKKRLLDILPPSKKKWVKFEGFTTDVWSHVGSADALILTSKYEGFPMTLCEAVSHGVFVVSSNCPTGPEDIVNSNNGLLYSPGNILELADIIENLSSKNSSFPSTNIVRGSIRKFRLAEYWKRFAFAVEKSNGQN